MAIVGRQHDGRAGRETQTQGLGHVDPLQGGPGGDELGESATEIGEVGIGAIGRAQDAEPSTDGRPGPTGEPPDDAAEHCAESRRHREREAARDPGQSPERNVGQTVAHRAGPRPQPASPRGGGLLDARLQGSAARRAVSTAQTSTTSRSNVSKSSCVSASDRAREGSGWTSA